MGRPRVLAGLVAAGMLLGLVQVVPAAAASPAATESIRPAAGRASVAPAPARGRAVMSRRGGVKHRRRVLFPYAPKASEMASKVPVRSGAASPSVVQADGAPVDVFATGGELLGDTAVAVFWNSASGLSPFQVELRDAASGTRVGPVIAANFSFFLCHQRTSFCAVFSANNGWPVVAGHSYFTIVTALVTGNPSTQSNTTTGRFTIIPPSLPTFQTFGCRCSSVSGRAGRIQALRADPVDSATGAYTETATDLSLSGIGVTFKLARSYTSLDTGGGLLGPGWAFGYDVRLQVAGNGDVGLHDEENAQYLYVKNPDGSFVVPPGAVSRLAAVTGGYRLDTPKHERLSFNSSGQLTTWADQRGHGLTFAYTSGRLSGITDFAGRTVGLSYNSGGLLASATLPDGRHVDYGYTSGRLSSVRDARGNTTGYGYDAAGRLSTVTDPLGHATTTIYGSSTGRVASQTDALGKQTTFAWNASTQTATTTDPNGHQWVDVYHDNALVESMDPDGNVTTYRYDEHLNLASVTDPMGNRTLMTYDGDGNLLTRTAPEPLGFVERWSYDANHDVLSHTDGRGNSETFTYDEFGERTSATDPEGNITTMAYDTNGQLTAQTDPRGNAPQAGQYVPVVPATLFGASVAAGGVVSFAATGVGGVPASGVGVVGVNVIALTPGAAGFLRVFPAGGTEPTDSTVNFTAGGGSFAGFEMARVGAGGQISVRNSASVAVTVIVRVRGYVQPASTATRDAFTTTYAYDAAGNRTAQTSPLGERTTWGYDSSGRPTSMVDPRGNASGANPADFTWAYAYDQADHLTRVTDPLGHATTTSYDAAGNKTSVTDALNRTTRYGYDADNRLTAVTDPAGGVTTSTYDPAGREIAEQDPEGNTTSFGYDPAGRLTSKVNPRGNTAGADPARFATAYSYDWNGNQIGTNHPDPAGGSTPIVTTTSYDVLNRPIKATDGNGHTTVTAYDNNGNVTQVTDSLSHTTSHAYDKANRLTATTDPRGKTTTIGYDRAGNRTSLTTPLGNKTTYTFDADSRQKAMTDPRGNASGANPADFTWAYAYDAAGHQTRVTDPLGHATTTSYDAAGNRSATTDANSHTTSFGYTAADELATVTAPAISGSPPIVTSYTYDEAGRLHTRTDPKGHTTTLDYDRAGRLTAQTKPGSRVWTFAYDPDGNQTQATDAAGNATPGQGDGTTTSSYDTLDRLVGIDYSDATPDVGYAYDPAGNRTRMSDGAGAQTYTYDNADHLTGVTRGGETFSYGYDPAGNVTTRIYPDTSTVSLTYDDDGRLATLAAEGATTSYAYDPAGNLRTTTLPSANGYVETRTYDRAGQLASLVNAKGTSVLSSFTYTRDPVGNPTQILTPQATQTATYDPLDRLTHSCLDSACTSFRDYTYDPAGSRLTESRSSGTTSYVYDQADQLCWTATGAPSDPACDAPPAGATRYGYDANGNQTSAGASSFTYDLANRLTASSDAAGTTGFAYDGDGTRIGRTDPDGTTSTLTWDLNQPIPQLVLERTSTGGLLRRYAYGNNQAITQRTPAGTFYLHHDALGSTVNLTSSTGATQWSLAYDPYGTTVTATSAPGAPELPRRFTGQTLDQPPGLHDFLAREYDATTGRFLQPDPQDPPTHPAIGQRLRLRSGPPHCAHRPQRQDQLLAGWLCRRAGQRGRRDPSRG